MDWEQARSLAYQAGVAAAGRAERVPLADADGRTLAEPLRALTDLPAFPTSSIDGWAVRGPGPWLPEGRVLAGGTPPPLSRDGACVEIATGAMVPEGATALVRIEDSTTGPDGRVSGEPRNGPVPDWRLPGEEAHRGEELLPAGTPIDPAVIGVAATCGYSDVPVYPVPRAAMLVFGDELLTEGPPGAGRVRDSLGPQVPGWLRRNGATVTSVTGPVKDTLDAHLDAIRSGLDEADVVCTTGGTMHGPVDHLHPALAELGADYIVNTVAVRPGFPMLLARVPGPRPRFIAGLPGNPQSAVIALISLVAPLLAGLRGRPLAPLPLVELSAAVRGRGGDTHLALAALDASGRTATPVGHVGSAMLRGLANAHGFVVVRPGSQAAAGDLVPFLPLPLTPGER
ncbi:molybdopterin molybdotransferase MoeA [Actinoplanes sp. OR16]|uniref:molybdopterin molybdotransferase MoeA n=1 Tax=Actinoplanes sp. OR16 TaxID=946334 RepID=UPI000FD8CBC6|nr:molybdopterin molybdotransferase MoeA [Actinoplanes sp. OR16]